jgi:hypothetical protein
MAMTETRQRYSDADQPAALPRNNPCAQCGTPILFPDWVEQDHGRVAYLWHCTACDYQFEAIAFYPDRDDRALAA